MKTFLLASTLWLLALSAQAATLIWDGTNIGPITIERGTSPTGPFTVIATVPDGTTQYILAPAAWGYYLVRNATGPSNTVQFAADLYAGPILDRLDAIEGRLTVLETPVLPPPPPAPTSNFTVTVIDADHLSVVGACTSIRSIYVSTARRTIECVH